MIYNRCYHEIKLGNGQYTYCLFERGHKGEHGPVNEVQREPELKIIPIPCSCLDCKAKREGKVRQ